MMVAVKELTKDEAIAFAESNVWETWTDVQIGSFQLFQPCLCVPMGRFHAGLEAALGRPVWTHEMTTAGVKRLQAEFLGMRQAPTMEEILDLIPPEKRVPISVAGDAKRGAKK